MKNDDDCCGPKKKTTSCTFGDILPLLFCSSYVQIVKKRRRKKRFYFREMREKGTCVPKMLKCPLISLLYWPLYLLILLFAPHIYKRTPLACYTGNTRLRFCDLLCRCRWTSQLYNAKFFSLSPCSHVNIFAQSGRRSLARTTRSIRQNEIARTKTTYKNPFRLSYSAKNNREEE